MRDISDITKSRKETQNEILAVTTSTFPDHIFYLKIQNDTLTEFLANLDKFDNLKIDDSNQFVVCFGLLNDMLRKQAISVDLIKKGYYDEAALMARHIMEASLRLIYLAKNQNSWEDWFKYQRYEEYKMSKGMGIPFYLMSSNYYASLLTKINLNQELFSYEKLPDNPSWCRWIESRDRVNYLLMQPIKRPRSVFSQKFKDFLALFGKAQYYIVYQKLCLWSHPSIETLRSSLELNRGPFSRYHFVPRFERDKAEFFFNVIFGFINDSIWEGFSKTFAFEGQVPSVLVKYKEMQEKAISTFNGFYA